MSVFTSHGPVLDSVCLVFSFLGGWGHVYLKHTVGELITFHTSHITVNRPVRSAGLGVVSPSNGCPFQRVNVVSLLGFV